MGMIENWRVTVTGFGGLAPNRRSVHRTFLAIVALIASILLAGCGTNRMPAPQAIADRAASAALVMIIRHGEKPDGSTAGVDANGNPDDSSLTQTGWNRARRLVDLFDPAQGSPRAGLSRPTAIYAAGANNNGEGQRTRETVKPLADKLGIPVNTSFGKGEEEALIAQVISQPGPTLISWQHGEIPAIAEAFPLADAGSAGAMARRSIRCDLDLHQDRRGLAVCPAARVGPAPGPCHHHRNLTRRCRLSCCHLQCLIIG